MSKVSWEVKLAVFRRDKYTCRYCSRVLSDTSRDPLMQPTVDHVIPRSKGGRSTTSNLVTACRECNTNKGSHDRPQVVVKSGALRLAEMKRWFA